MIGKQHRGAFKRVFEQAQNQLRTKFGMEMVELPVKTKNTMKEKRGHTRLLPALAWPNMTQLR